MQPDGLNPGKTKPEKNTQYQRTIVIAGGGTAGWMAANLFAKRWTEHKIKIILVESPKIGIIGVGEGSTPTLKRFFKDIDIPETDWMPACNATYKGSIQFCDWSPASGVAAYRHPFTSQTDTFTRRDFEVNCRTRRLGLDTHTVPDDFLINGILAQQGKGPKTPANFPFQMEYGYHFDSGLLGQYLCKVAVKRGVEHKRAEITGVTTHPNGHIKAIVSDAGEHIEGDFFIDCTGFKSLLLQQQLGVKFNSYQNNLFNDSAVVMPTAICEEIPVETKATALSNGWCWKIPLTHRFGNGYVYSSKYLNADEAETEFRRHLGMLDSDETCRHLKMKVGQVARHWEKNCLALGLSQGFMEPLEATALHLVQICAEFFINKYQEGNFSNTHQRVFNQFAKERFDGVRDYIVAHYKLNTRDDSQYWRDNRNNDHISASLANIIRCWFNREDLALEVNRQNIAMHWEPISWHCLFSGYGAYPALHPNQPNQGDLYKQKHIREFLEGCALNFQSHAENLKALAS